MYEKGRIELFNKQDLERLNSAIFNVLENIGIRVKEDNLLEILKKKGFKMDKGKKVIKFSSKDIERIIERQKKRKIKEKLPKNESVTDEYTTEIGPVVAPFYYDFDNKERRPATKRDLIDMICFSDARGDKASLPLTPRDFNPLIEPIESFALLIEYAHKPTGAYATSSAQIKYLARMNEVFYGRRFPPRGPDFMISPLTMGPRLARYLLELRKYKISSLGLGTQPISGASAPLSIAGNIVIGASEILGGWMIIRALFPEASLDGGICSGIVDVRKGVVLFNTPEAILQTVGLVELFDKLYAGHVEIAAGADYIDAKLPGFEALHERVYRTLAHSAFTGNIFYVGGSGTLDGGRIFSPIQFLLDEEIGKGIWQFSKGIPVDKDSIGLEAIQEVGFSGESYLETEHTLRHCRKGFWLPNLFERTVWHDLKTELDRERRMLERANEEFKETLSKYEKPERDCSLLKELRRIIEKARLQIIRKRSNQIWSEPRLSNNR